MAESVGSEWVSWAIVRGCRKRKKTSGRQSTGFKLATSDPLRQHVVSRSSHAPPCIHESPIYTTPLMQHRTLNACMRLLRIVHAQKISGVPDRRKHDLPTISLFSMRGMCRTKKTFQRNYRLYYHRTSNVSPLSRQVASLDCALTPHANWKAISRPAVS